MAIILDYRDLIISYEQAISLAKSIELLYNNFILATIIW